MCFMDAMKVTPDNAASAAADKLMGMLNAGAATLMLSVGHRTGLFDRMAEMSAAGSDEIAAKSGMNERYVREWLGAMVVAGIVEHDDAAGTYLLQPEMAALLTRGGEANMAGAAQFIPVLASVEDRIVECFERGGGLRYEEYPRFHEVMAEESRQTVVASLLEHVLPLVDGLRERLQAGINVLDVGCGRGMALTELAAAFPNSKFVGYDLCPEAIAFADGAASGRGLPNVHFAVQDVAEMRDAARFDLITAFDAIHDQAQPDVVLGNIRRALRAEGVFLMQDIMSSTRLNENAAHPLATFLYAISCMHCMSVSLAQNGMGLGAMWGKEQAEEMLRDAGFTSIEVRTLEHDVMNYWYVVR